MVAGMASPPHHNISAGVAKTTRSEREISLCFRMQNCAHWLYIICKCTFCWLGSEASECEQRRNRRQLKHSRSRSPQTHFRYSPKIPSTIAPSLPPRPNNLHTMSLEATETVANGRTYTGDGEHGFRNTFCDECALARNTRAIRRTNAFHL